MEVFEGSWEALFREVLEKLTLEGVAEVKEAAAVDSFEVLEGEVEAISAFPLKLIWDFSTLFFVFLATKQASRRHIIAAARDSAC